VGAPERVRVVKWDDPLEAAAKGLQLSGLEALQAAGRGEIPVPPIAALMGIEGGSVEEGEVFLGVQPGEYHYSNTGAAHGGLAATLLDSAMYLAVHSTLAQGVFASTLEIKINYVRPITVDTGYVMAHGYLIHRGRQLATAAGEARGPTGKLLAHGTTTCLIRE
jgi:uncharacterized protein (TIGR00369 family)